MSGETAPAIGETASAIVTAPAPDYVRAPVPITNPLPKYVEACRNNPNRKRTWSVATWDKVAGPEAGYKCMAFRCGSWRCPCEDCRRYRASIDFARIRDALAAADPADVVYLVLTLDRSGRYTGKPWRDVASAYRELGSLTSKFLKRVNRLLRKRGLEGTSVVVTGPDGKSRSIHRWVMTVEAHRGPEAWPHANLVVVSKGLAQLVRETEGARLVPSQKAGRDVNMLSGELLDHAVACGWGPMSSVEIARNSEALAGYMMKLAGEFDKATAEIVKLCQLPIAAPSHTRRLRAGKGFLPARIKNEERTGVLLSDDGTPFGTSKDEARARAVDFVVAAEQAKREAGQTEPSEIAARREDLRRAREDDRRFLARLKASLAAEPVRPSVEPRTQAVLRSVLEQAGLSESRQTQASVPSEAQGVASSEPEAVAVSESEAVAKPREMQIRRSLMRLVWPDGRPVARLDARDDARTGPGSDSS